MKYLVLLFVLASCGKMETLVMKHFNYKTKKYGRHYLLQTCTQNYCSQQGCSDAYVTCIEEVIAITQGESN